jgi:hypothetical protein
LEGSKEKRTLSKFLRGEAEVGYYEGERVAVRMR